jgi:hypothetical protein
MIFLAYRISDIAIHVTPCEDFGGGGQLRRDYRARFGTALAD